MFTVLGAPGGHIQYSGNSFSTGAAARLRVSDSEILDDGFMQYIQTQVCYLMVVSRTQLG